MPSPIKKEIEVPKEPEVKPVEPIKTIEEQFEKGKTNFHIENNVNPHGPTLQQEEIKITGKIYNDKIITFTSNDATPSIKDGNLFTEAYGSATSITTFDDGTIGQIITIIFTTTNVTIVETDNIKLSAAFTGSADDIIVLIYNGTSWFEVSRSVN